MKKTVWILLAVTLAFKFCTAQSGKDQDAFHVVPEPVSIKAAPGTFNINSTTALVAGDKTAAEVASSASRLLGQLTDYRLALTTASGAPTTNAIIFKLNKTPEAQLGREGYKLLASDQNVTISANQPAGLFYGLQTLLQLLPPQKGKVHGRQMGKAPQWVVPGVAITDYPRFGWRGLMLDVSRHFFSKEFVKSYIDEMAKYKYNVFHWHLTDDQGWRIEIKGLPRLTEVGAWRVPRTGRWGTFTQGAPGEKATDGGFYTQDDIREIVDYARKRFITIVPEVDVPAHSLALIAAYPNLSCTQLPYAVPPQYAPGSDDNVLCVANDSTWLILDKIFTQIAALFPGKYIHVGGDEANRSFWMKDPKDIALMKREHITTPAGLQSYFEARLEKLIHSKGKSMMGWDEILEGGLPPDATVMSWRGIKGGIEAARQKHHVVMTPTGSCYLDYLQGDPRLEPPAGGMLRLSTCYAFEPVPAGIDSSYILGGQGNLWAENVPNGRHAEYMTWPRALALSEVFWSPASKRNWPDFVKRMESQFRYLKASHVKYATSAYNPIVTGVKGGDSLEVKLSTEIPGITLYYTFDGTNPDRFYPRYEAQPLSIPKGATEIRVIGYRNGRPVGSQLNFPLSDLKNHLETH